MTNSTQLAGSPAVRPMRADARRNYERLLTAASDVFMEEGTSAALEEVARRADVGIGTLYRHFPSREDLLDAVMQSSFQRLHDEAERCLTLDDPLQAIDDYINFWLRQTAVYKGIGAECINHALEPERRSSSCCQLTKVDMRLLLERAQRAGLVRPDVTYKDVWRLMSGFVMGLRDADASTPEARVMIDVILRGLRTPEALAR
ncbi:MAG TPA: helix-turn-helix domain-containing protein [Thermomicrobiales bacterium]|nr:helix-turn-helix domain-containing protein [Thermomicrobiales bacterium]